MFPFICCSSNATVDLKLEVDIVITILRVKLASCVIVKSLSGYSAFLLVVDKSNKVLIRILLTMPPLLHVWNAEGRATFHRCSNPSMSGLTPDGLTRSRHRSSLTHVEPNSHETSSPIDVSSRNAYGKTDLPIEWAQGNLKMMRETIDAAADVSLAEITTYPTPATMVTKLPIKFGTSPVAYEHRYSCTGFWDV
jgi:hypothetical protein